MELHYVAGPNSGNHWATEANHDGRVIAQLQEQGKQARVYMTPDQAEAFANELLLQVKIARYGLPAKERQG